MKNLFRVGLVTRHARTRPYSDIDSSVYMSFKVLLERTKKIVLRFMFKLEVRIFNQFLFFLPSCSFFSVLLFVCFLKELDRRASAGPKITMVTLVEFEGSTKTEARILYPVEPNSRVAKFSSHSISFDRVRS